MSRALIPLIAQRKTKTMAMQAKVMGMLLSVYMFAMNRSLNYKLHFFPEAGGEVLSLPWLRYP